ncbi:unnamed protein product [Parnassius apollo]|uniref:(apollo) hypothetical protein n=1 Tax=Parnassius apollo TaxID=110799 RepID=A0A8S3W6A0_PARAO|nr:unnamed protein product [Parnassius apollo]
MRISNCTHTPPRRRTSTCNSTSCVVSNCTRTPPRRRASTRRSTFCAASNCIRTPPNGRDTYSKIDFLRGEQLHPCSYLDAAPLLTDRLPAANPPREQFSLQQTLS